jgi:hypothetical protein
MSEPVWELPAVPAFDWQPLGWVPHVDAPTPDAGGLDARTQEAEAQREAAEWMSSVLNTVPVIGTFKHLAEAFWGHDLVTGDDKPWWERLLSIGAAVNEGAEIVEGVHDTWEVVPAAHPEPTAGVPEK